MTPSRILLYAVLLAPGAHAVDTAVVADAGALPPPIEPRDDVDAGTTATGAPGVVVNARVEPDPVAFAGRFELVIEVTRERGAAVALPEDIPSPEDAPRAGDPRRHVEELPRPDAGAAPARVKETIRIPFLALGLDDVKTPALVLKLQNGDAVDVAALPVRVTPEEPPAPPNDPKTGKPVEGLVLEPAVPVLAYAVPDGRPAAAAAAFAAAGVAYGVLRFFERRRRLLAPPAPKTPPPPPRPAHEVALERLEALLAAGLLQRGEVAVFVERLMDEVLRDYLSQRFALTAGSRTTRELVQELLGVAVVGLDVGLIERLLADADLVKFARAAVTPDHAHAMAARVRALVEATALRATMASSTPSSTEART